MDARRSQVYNALFRCCDRKMERLCPDRAIGIDELKDELKTYSENIYVVGDGADICADHFSDLKNVKFTSQLLKFQNAVNVAEIAYMRYNNHEYIDGRRLVPSYLRLSQAERVRAEKLGKLTAEVYSNKEQAIFAADWSLIYYDSAWGRPWRIRT